MVAEDRGAGRSAVDRMIEHWREEFDAVLPDRPDLIVVPECCDRYQHHDDSRASAYYRERGDRVLEFFAEVARRNRCHITYPAVRLLPDDTWRNSIQLIDRTGQVVGIYDKNHPTIDELRMGIIPGTETPLLECDFGRAGCAICFDLNFDDVRLSYTRQKPALILFASAFHGGLMQPYWAYSCRAHLASAVAGLPSGVLSPVGHVIAETTNYYDFVTATVNLDCRVAHLDFNGEKLEALKRAYGPEVSVFDPGLLGSVLITSESEGRTADELLDEFGIERLDQYFARCLADRARHAGPRSA